MFYNTQTARRPRKSPPAATELSRLLLHDVVCTSAASALQCIMQQNGPTCSLPGGDRRAQHVFVPGDLDL